MTLRFVLGCGISIVLLALTLTRVDLPAAGAAIGTAAPGFLLLALAIVMGDLVLRALRWKGLLRPLSPLDRVPAFGPVLGYLSIGYLANALLPARLGDVARAYLAADSFGIGRLTTFGSIVVERVADGLTMLALATVSVLVVGAVGGAGDLISIAMVAVAAGLVGFAVGWIVLARSRLGRSRLGSITRASLSRIGDGTMALRDPRGSIRFTGLTAAVTLTALLVAWAVTRSVGLALAPMEIALFVSAVALSLAIPAAPGAIGTYEFVGVAILTSLGYSPELALATILLMRVLTTVPLIGAGIMSLWMLQLRPSTLVRSRVIPAES